MDYEQKVLLDSVWFKLRNNEPMSTHDFRRLMDLIGNAQFSLETASEDEIRALQSQFIGLLQKKFMQGG